MEEAKTSDQQCVTHDESDNTNELSHDSNRNQSDPVTSNPEVPTSTLNSAQRRNAESKNKVFMVLVTSGERKQA